MKVSDISEQDALMAASLLQTLAVAERLMDALKLAGLPITGPGLDKRTEAGKWLGGIAQQMAAQFKASKEQAPAASQTMRVKSAGPLPGAAASASPKKGKRK